MFARARVTLGRPRSVIEVPRKALGRDGDKDYVLVVNDRKQVERRTVQTELLEVVKGPGIFLPVPGSDDQKAFIKEGLSPEDWVIIDNIKVQPGDEVEVKRAKDAPEPLEPKK
jgi:multidrug efflux pump subunit AcrA (membrane-fusion protein)